MTVTTSQLMPKPKQDLSGIQVVCRFSSKPRTPDASCWENWLLSTCLSIYALSHTPELNPSFCKEHRSMAGTEQTQQLAPDLPLTMLVHQDLR